MAIEGELHERVGAIKFAELLIDAAQSLVKFSLFLWIAVESLCLLNAAIEQCGHSQIIRGTGSRIPALEQVHHEVLDALGSRGFIESCVFGARETDGEENH